MFFIEKITNYSIFLPIYANIYIFFQKNNYSNE